MWILILVVVIASVLLLHFILPKNYVSPRDYWYLRKIPSLPSYPYLGSAHLFLVPNEDFIPLLVKIYNDHKPIFRINILGFQHVFISDINDLMVIFNSRLHIEKSEDYVFLMPWLGTGLLTSTGQKWLTHRKLLTPAFHFQILEQYIDILNKNASILVEQLKTQANKEFIEINPLVTLCTLDVICETAMGTSVGAQVGGEKDYVKATLRMSRIFQERLLAPWLYRPCIFNLTPQGREQKKLLTILHGFTDKVIQERKRAYKQEKVEKKSESHDPELYFGGNLLCMEVSDWFSYCKPSKPNVRIIIADHPQPALHGKKKVSFLDLMIEISETENKLTEEEIREEVDTFMFEGHDTTSAAICWALFELGHHPDIQERAYEEQRNIFENSSRAVTSSDLHEMKYLERVIKEALRLYPSVPIISRRLETDVTLKGYLIPKGTNVPAFIYYIHRDPNLYPNPTKFDPDRFLTDQILSRHPYAYIPFSAGSRNCIGQKFAEMEEKVILSYIIRNFKFKSLDSRDDIVIMGELILRPKNSLRISFEPRQQMYA